MNGHENGIYNYISSVLKSWPNTATEHRVEVCAKQPAYDRNDDDTFANNCTEIQA